MRAHVMGVAESRKRGSFFERGDLDLQVRRRTTAAKSMAKERIYKGD